MHASKLVFICTRSLGRAVTCGARSQLVSHKRTCKLADKQRQQQQVAGMNLQATYQALAVRYRVATATNES